MAGAAIRRESRARIAQQGQVRREAAAAKKQEWLDNSKVTRRGRRRVNNPTTSGTSSTGAAVGAGVAAGVGATAAATATAKPAATDQSSLSSSAQATAQNNPYDGVADGVTTVKVEPWSPENASKSTLDGILQSQGYTPEEIYSKGADGKSLLDRVSAVNDLKNPNLIHPDQQLKIPMKEQAEGANAAPQEASVSSSDVSAGDSATTLVRNEDDRLSAKTTMEKSEDGVPAAMVESRNHENRDGSLTSAMMTDAGGKVVSHSEETDQGVESVTMGRSSDGSALTVQDQVLHSEGSDLTITDADDNKNLTGAIVDDQLIVGNPGDTEGSGVASGVDLSENANDGWFERAGRGIAEAFGFQGETNKPVDFDGASEISVVRGKEGETSVFAKQDGEVSNIYNTAGDTDDTWIERAGEGMDNFFKSFTPDVPRSEDPNYELTARGYRRKK